MLENLQLYFLEETNFSKAFGKSVKKWRKKKGHTQTQLSEILQTTRAKIVLIEAGKNTEPELYFKIILLLKVSNIDLNVWFNDIFISISDDYKQLFIQRNFRLF